MTITFPSSPSDDTPEPKRGRGRPSTGQYPVIRAYHIDTGDAIAWSDGVFAGNADLVKIARRVAESEETVGLTPTGPFVKAGADTPDRAAAAMLMARPGRMILLDTPPALRGNTGQPGLVY